MILFMAAVLAFPSTSQLRLMGLAAGLPAIQLINLVRLVSLYWSGIHRPQWFTFLHIVVWQTAVILVGVAIFIIWSSRVARDRA
jgi:exosortase/archaeosortase family protein